MTATTKGTRDGTEGLTPIGVRLRRIARDLELLVDANVAHNRRNVIPTTGGAMTIGHASVGCSCSSWELELEATAGTFGCYHRG